MRTLCSLAADLANGTTSSARLVEECLANIADPAGEGGRVFIKVHAEAARRSADDIDRRRRSGEEVPPFAGIPISLKDLFDEKGEVTTSGSAVLRGTAPAARDSETAARLRDAGFIVIGRTNMTEFAYSGIGYNPHYGTPANPWERAVGRVPGGSSSGAAVSVTDGMAFGGIGSDTGGSCRVPAAFCGITGFKPTASSIPQAGVLPLSHTLDGVGVLAASATCCAILYEALSGQQASSSVLSVGGLSFGVPRNLVFDGIEAHVETSFRRAVAALSGEGAKVKEFDLPLFDALGAMSNKGGLSAAEAFAWHRRHGLWERRDEYDRRVAARIARGAEQSAADYLDLLSERQRLIAEDKRTTPSYDALIFPTTPIVAPTLAAIETDEEFQRLNLLSLRNPSIVNVLDRCAISIPCQPPGTAPVGLMVVGRHGEDQHLLAIATAVEKALGL